MYILAYTCSIPGSRVNIINVNIIKKIGLINNRISMYTYAIILSVYVNTFNVIHAHTLTLYCGMNNHGDHIKYLTTLTYIGKQGNSPV